jgi:hypothetical protein
MLPRYPQKDEIRTVSEGDGNPDADTIAAANAEQPNGPIPFLA